MKEIVQLYDQQLASYYQKYEEELNSILAGQSMSEDFLKKGSAMRAAAGALGARIGKAGQRAKRQFVFEKLVAARKEGADLTFHKVQEIAQATVGRHFNNNLVHKSFSTKGRTARSIDRSVMSDGEVRALIDAIKPEVEALTRLLAIKRAERSSAWAVAKG